MRMNIYVPDQLKARMDAVREEVNWSALACRAFESELGAISARKAKKNMSDVINRLRASRQSQQGAAFREGQEVGAAWAKNRAEAIELERLQDHAAAMQRERLEPFGYGELLAPLTWSAHFYGIVTGQNPPEDQDVCDFWNALVDEAARVCDDPDFLNGFTAGALKVWNQVKDEI